MRDCAKRRPRKFIYKLTRSAGQNAATRSAKPGRGHPSKWKRGAKIEKGRWTRPHRRQANGRSIDGSDTATAQMDAAGIFAPMYAQKRPRVLIWNNENKIFLDAVCRCVYICVCGCNSAPNKKEVAHMIMKIYPVFITLDGKLNGDFTTDEIKYNTKSTISDAKKIYRKLIKLSGLDKGEITVFNENCSIKCLYTFDGTKFLKKEW